MTGSSFVDTFGSRRLFLALYLLGAASTYAVDFHLAGSALSMNLNVTDPEDVVMPTVFGVSRFTIVTICYLVMTEAAMVRGLAIRRWWLVAFPVAGGFFDLFVVFLPLVPTVFHVVVLTVGYNRAAD